MPLLQARITKDLNDSQLLRNNLLDIILQFMCNPQRRKRLKLVNDFPQRTLNQQDLLLELFCLKIRQLNVAPFADQLVEVGDEVPQLVGGGYDVLELEQAFEVGGRPLEVLLFAVDQGHFFEVALDLGFVLLQRGDVLLKMLPKLEVGNLLLDKLILRISNCQKPLNPSPQPPLQVPPLLANPVLPQPQLGP